MILDSLKYDTIVDQKDQQFDSWDTELEDENPKYDHKMYIAALGFYGLPPTWNRTFTKHLLTDKDTGAPIIDEKTGKQRTTLRSCNPSKACVQGKAVWVQVNEPREGCATFTSKYGKTYPKKATNQDIAIIRNVTLDFEYPPEPQKAHAVARKLVGYLARIGLCEPDHPIENSGAGAHIGLTIQPIECATPEISTLLNGAVARVVKRFIQPEFDRLCEEAGIEMDLEAYDIGRILSFPGTWRPTNPDKDDAEFLKAGYLRRWLEPYVDGNYPVRKENAKLTQLIQEAFAVLQNEHKEMVKKGKEYLDTHPNIKAGNLLPDMTDDALNTWIMGWENGAEFTELLYGGWCGHNSASSADLALCNYYAAATGKDPVRMDQLFRLSGLMRPKWDRPARSGEIYGEGTIQRAIDGCTFEYDPNFGKREEAKRLEEDLKEMIKEHKAKYANPENEQEDTSEKQDSSNQDEQGDPFDTEYSIPSEDEDPKEEATKSTFEQVKELLNKAIEEGNIETIYALAGMIVRLPLAQEQASIKSILQSRKKAIPSFSMAAYNDCIKEAKNDLRQNKTKERYKDHLYNDIAPYYKEEGSGMKMTIEPTEKNPEPDPVKISNFTAEIVTDITVDDGAEKTRLYEIEVELTGQLFNFEVPVEDFPKCDWIDIHIGARARLEVFARVRDHLIAAIKYVSHANEKNYYAHTGWRKINGVMVYLHNDGCLGQLGQIPSENLKDLTHPFFISQSAYRATLYPHLGHVGHVGHVDIEAYVKLTGSLANYVFPPDRENTQQAIRASIGFMDLTKDTITMPIFAAVWRSILGDVDFGIHLAGQTGLGKSEVCALVQQYFGSSMNARKLPGSWESTVNSLEMLLFQSKDALVVVDDFKPKGSKNDQDRLHANADRVFRQIGNGQSRARLDSNLKQRPERRPRCFLLSTGEDVPKGQSCQARAIVVMMDESVTSGEASKRLAIAQKDARDGLYAQALAGYIEWLAPCIEAIQAQLPELIAQERDRLNNDGHSRAGTNTANLILGMRCFLQYACEMDAITPQEAENYLRRCTSALIEIVSDASRENHQMKPSEQWKQLLVSAITSGHAHLVTLSGDNPGGNEYGWKKSIRSYTDSEGNANNDETLHPGGPQVGWVDGDEIYLLPVVAYKAVRDMGSKAGNDVTTSEVVLRKFLAKDGLLALTNLDKARKTVTVRPRHIPGRPDVLHIKKEILFPVYDGLSNIVDPHVPLDPDGSKSASGAASTPGQVFDKKDPGSSDTVDPQSNQRPLPLNRPCFHCKKQNWQWDELIEGWTCGECNHG